MTSDKEGIFSGKESRVMCYKGIKGTLLSEKYEKDEWAGQRKECVEGNLTLMALKVNIERNYKRGFLKYIHM